MFKRAVLLSVIAHVAVFAFFSGSEAELSALPGAVEAPSNNPTSDEKVALGRLLFWDPILSGRQDVACATCHHPSFGYAENRDISIGVNGTGLGEARRFGPGSTIPFVKRNSQTILNTAFNGADTAGRHDASRAPMFWDLRVRSLEAQALEPIKTLEEMRGDVYTAEQALSVVVSRLAAIAEYRTRFTRAFGGPAPVSAANLGRAIAAFERTLVAANSPFDRFMRGNSSAMTPLQVSGMRRFARIGCANCHSGPMFSDYEAHVIGVPDNPKLASSDEGVSDTYAFRTPSLRNLAFTAPYMHNGVLRTLEDVVRFYDDVRRRDLPGRPNRARNPNVAAGDLDPFVRSLNLGGGPEDLVAFLRALSDPAFDRAVPESVPSGLPVGGQIE